MFGVLVVVLRFDMKSVWFMTLLFCCVPFFFVWLGGTGVTRKSLLRMVKIGLTVLVCCIIKRMVFAGLQMVMGTSGVSCVELLSLYCWSWSFFC